MDFLFDCQMSMQLPATTENNKEGFCHLKTAYQIHFLMTTEKSLVLKNKEIHNVLQGCGNSKNLVRKQPILLRQRIHLEILLVLFVIHKTQFQKFKFLIYSQSAEKYFSNYWVSEIRSAPAIYPTLILLKFRYTEQTVFFFIWLILSTFFRKFLRQFKYRTISARFTLKKYFGSRFGKQREHYVPVLALVLTLQSILLLMIYILPTCNLQIYGHIHQNKTQISTNKLNPLFLFVVF
eukprot:TRINITY_DN25679_c1_g1_i5.p1 TRINITY_DN25679_c1_g1~~TRINITY_DN25679_c1_g1_i5.p1  ORF type:complete len:236 (+),score=-13.71 TRINITY_DN25679_c1_g1_i5:377-1084(+)